MMYRPILAIVLLVYALFGTGWLDLLDTPFPNPEPEPVSKILDIEVPSEEVKQAVESLEGMVSDPSDRAKLAIFNYDFAQRVLSYEADSQQVNDIYTLAGKTFFKNTLVDKYTGLSEEIVALLVECMGEENHVLTQEEKNKLHEYFMGVAWVLIQKGQ